MDVYPGLSAATIIFLAEKKGKKIIKKHKVIFSCIYILEKIFTENIMEALPNCQEFGIWE